jgi:hypothetical protein
MTAATQKDKNARNNIYDDDENEDQIKIMNMSDFDSIRHIN